MPGRRQAGGPVASAARGGEQVTARRRAPALGAALLLAVGGVLAVVVLAACSGAASTTLCHPHSAPVHGGANPIIKNGWPSAGAQCITTDGSASFTVVNSSIARNH